MHADDAERHAADTEAHQALADDWPCATCASRDAAIDRAHPHRENRFRHLNLQGCGLPTTLNPSGERMRIEAILVMLVGLGFAGGRVRTVSSDAARAEGLHPGARSRHQPHALAAVRPSCNDGVHQVRAEVLLQAMQQRPAARQCLHQHEGDVHEPAGVRVLRLGRIALAAWVVVAFGVAHAEEKEPWECAGTWKFSDGAWSYPGRGHSEIEAVNDTVTTCMKLNPERQRMCTEVKPIAVLCKRDGDLPRPLKPP